MSKAKRGFHYVWHVGRFEVGYWNDTGKPPFRLLPLQKDDRHLSANIQSVFV